MEENSQPSAGKSSNSSSSSRALFGFWVSFDFSAAAAAAAAVAALESDGGFFGEDEAILRAALMETDVMG